MFIDISFAQKGGNDDEILYHEDLHQKLVIEAYKLLKEEVNDGKVIPIMDDHVGTTAWASWPFWHDQLVSGAHGEDYQDVVFGYTSTVLPWPIDWDLVGSDPYVTMSHFWSADAGDYTLNDFGIPFGDRHNSFTKARRFIDGQWDIPLFFYSNPVYTYEMYYNNLFDAYTDYEIYVTGRWNYLGQYYPISPTKINSYFSQETATEYRDDIFWDIVGRLCHLLGDMAVPAHVHIDTHADVWPASDGDQWENFTIGTTLYRDWEDALNAGGIIDGITDKDDPLRYIFYTMNQIADYYPSFDAGWNRDGDGNSFYNPIFQTDYYSELDDFFTYSYGAQSVITTSTDFQNRIEEMKDVLITSTIRAQASLLYWIGDQTGLIPPYLYVPSQHATLASALDVARPGHTIFVAPGTHTVSSSLTVPAGVTLEIEPGATLRFIGAQRFTIDGTLIANGTPSNLITLKSFGSSKWIGIKFNDSSNDEESSLTYCKIDNASNGIWCNYANPLISNCTIEDCSYGIYLTYPNANTNKIINNTITNSSYEGIYQKYGYSEIHNNEISDNGRFGLRLYHGDSEIHNNSVNDNGHRGIYLTNSDPIITKNLIYDNATDGVYCYSYSDPDFWGYSYSNNVIAYNNSHGIYVTSTCLPLISGYPYSNSLYDNGTLAKEVYSFQSSTVYAQFNWWGEYPPEGGRIYGNVNTIYPSYMDWNPDPHGLSKSIASGSESPPADQTSSQNLPSNDKAHKTFYEGYLLEVDFKHEDALVNYKTVIAKYPESFEAMMSLSRIRKCLKQSDRLKEYEPYLSSIYEPNKDRYIGAKVLEMQIPLLVRTKSINEALANCATLIKDYPDDDEMVKNALFQSWLMHYHNTKDLEAAKSSMDQYGSKYTNDDDDYIFMMLAMGEITPEQAESLAKANFQDSNTNDQNDPTSLAFVLSTNYPNPFNPETKIQFALPNDSDVKLQIFNIRGQVVATPFEGNLPAGYHIVNFNASALPSGTYFYKITAGEITDVKKMVLVK